MRPGMRAWEPSRRSSDAMRSVRHLSCSRRASMWSWVRSLAVRRPSAIDGWRIRLKLEETPALKK